MNRPLRSVRPTLGCLEPRRLCDAGQHPLSPFHVRQGSGAISTSLPSAAERSREIAGGDAGIDLTESRRPSADPAGESDDATTGDREPSGGRPERTKLDNPAVKSQRVVSAALATGATAFDHGDAPPADMAMMIDFMPDMQVMSAESTHPSFDPPHSNNHAPASPSGGTSPVAMAMASVIS